MINRVKKKYYYFLFGLLLFAGIIFRFYNLNWGAPYYFHPDERNIASSITKLNFPDQLNPQFFAYGSLPIYIIYITGLAVSSVTGLLSKSIPTSITFENALFIGRFYSATLSLFTIYVLYHLGKTLDRKVTGLIAASLALFSVGYIQYAHFSTFEMWLSFFILLLTYLLICYWATKSFRFILFTYIISGILISIKVSTLVYLPIVTVIFFAKEVLNIRKHESRKVRFKKILYLLGTLFLLLGISATTIIATSPYYVFDSTSFISSIQYESSVALGTLKVFYTQIFEQTQPIFYPLIKVYPFILNPFITLFAIVSTIYCLTIFLKKKNTALLIIMIFFIITFLSQAFLFVKWTRYYIPTLSFLYLFIAIFTSKIIQSKRYRSLALLSISVTICISIFYSFSFMKTVLINTDTRIEASNWANAHIPRESQIISEIYDMGIVPFNQYFQNIKLFDFYDLDNSVDRQSELNTLIADADYIILPSHRILESRLDNARLYPKGNAFYQHLVDGKLGFIKQYQTPCDIFCRILYMGNPVFTLEQTSNVFDRPTLMIFKSIK